MPKTNAEKQRDFMERMRLNGFVRSFYWLKPEWKEAMDKLYQELKEQQK